MILILSAQQPTLDSPVNARFGRAPWLIKIDLETNKWEAQTNPGVNQSGGAGVAAAQYVIDQKAEVVVSGDFGPNAAGAFRAAKIQMRLYTPEAATIEQAVTLYKEDKLTSFE